MCSSNIAKDPGFKSSHSHNKWNRCVSPVNIGMELNTMGFYFLVTGCLKWIFSPSPWTKSEVQCELKCSQCKKLSLLHAQWALLTSLSDCIWLPQMETFKLYYKCWVSKCTYCTNLQTVCFKSGQRKWKIVSDHPCTIKHCYTHTRLMSVWWFFKLWFIELSWLNTVTLLLGNYCRILGWNW